MDDDAWRSHLLAQVQSLASKATQASSAEGCAAYAKAAKDVAEAFAWLAAPSNAH